MTFTFDEKISRYNDIQLFENRPEKSDQKQGLFFHQNIQPDGRANGCHFYISVGNG